MLKKKSISFCNILYVYIIQHKDDLKDIKNVLWWDSYDYTRFRINYINNKE